MAIAGFNPAAEMSQLRTQRTLAMQATAAADPSAAAGAADPAAMAAASAAVPGAAGDAAIAASAVQEPPSTSKIVLQSMLKGAVTGASVSLGIKQFGPLLTKLPFLNKVIPSAVGFLSKLPLVGKVLPLLGKSGLQGFVIAGLIGAGVGAIAGALSGVKKAREAQAQYADALAAQQQAPQPGDPVNTDPGAAQRPAPPAKPRFKNWVIAYSGHSKRPGSTGTYKVRSGDTVASLAARFHTTAAEIKRLNPSIVGEVRAGQTLKLKRKVVKKAA